MKRKEINQKEKILLVQNVEMVILWQYMETEKPVVNVNIPNLLKNNSNTKKVRKRI